MPSEVHSMTAPLQSSLLLHSLCMEKLDDAYNVLLQQLSQVV